MADKEERIIIAVAEPSLLEGGADNIYPCMTRQEAIDIMAKAICKSDGICTSHDCENCTEWSGNDILVAEIALNALLER